MKKLSKDELKKIQGGINQCLIQCGKDNFACYLAAGGNPVLEAACDADFAICQANCPFP